MKKNKRSEHKIPLAAVFTATYALLTLVYSCIAGWNGILLILYTALYAAMSALIVMYEKPSTALAIPICAVGVLCILLGALSVFIFITEIRATTANGVISGYTALAFGLLKCLMLYSASHILTAVMAFCSAKGKPCKRLNKLWFLPSVLLTPALIGATVVFIPFIYGRAYQGAVFMIAGAVVISVSKLLAMLFTARLLCKK